MFTNSLLPLSRHIVAEVIRYSKGREYSAEHGVESSSMDDGEVALE